jgi:hypothetical protein
MDQIDAIVEELRAISERLNDASMLLLSDAIERGETTRPAMEKQISQARRAVEKAVHHLVQN